ncbi:hypothetical protein RBLE17_15030 [Rhodobacteraceae bacterium LE17]|nr:hypothetical protein [Rhodobacteraceae bacterium LE17]
MLDAENDYFSTPMARPYGYVAPRLVARIFQSPPGIWKLLSETSA